MDLQEQLKQAEKDLAELQRGIEELSCRYTDAFASFTRAVMVRNLKQETVLYLRKQIAAQEGVEEL